MKVIGAFLPLLTLAFATPSRASNSWGSYHWARTSTPFTLQLLNNTSSAEWNSFLGLVSADWSQSSVLHTNIMSGTGAGNCKAKTGAVQICNRKYGFNGWLGLAQIWVSGDHITKATVKVNDSYFNTASYNDDHAQRHVLCQEVGHTFGLGHQASSDSNSCMDDVNGLFDPAFVGPNAHDYEQLAAAYGSHADASTTVAQLAKSAASDEEGPDVPANFGRPVGTGRVPEVLFVKELPDGRKLFTHVVPAPVGIPDGR